MYTVHEISGFKTHTSYSGNPADEYNLVLMDSHVSGLTINSVHMASERPTHRISRPNSIQSFNERISVSPIITVIPPDMDIDDAWDHRIPSPKQFASNNTHNHRRPNNLPTIVEPPDLEPKKVFRGAKTLRPHGLKITIPQGFLSSSQSRSISPRIVGDPHTPTSSNNSLKVDDHPGPRPHRTISATSLRTSATSQTLNATPSPVNPSSPTSTNFTPLPSPCISLNISVHSRKSSIDSTYLTPSILDDRPSLRRAGFGSGDDEDIFHAFPPIKHFNPVVWAWIALILTTVMVFTMIVYDFTILGITGGHTTLETKEDNIFTEPVNGT
ncbi:hypothetical protein BC936DRAFT_147118 [Jimgerdemannia flammicorona]|uniref:Uncharacterized protein n=1 Tax=Jimgerdemannia flammicorona TaxID=994334 RepID=A0A433D665_9FUNG|nr:hypothetical protein BC936DRAFT_147118 [Jimgerdemannia flammicorona]